MKDTLEKRLVELALHTLNVLETHHNWNAHTVYAIADKSAHLGLSRNDGFFKSIVSESATNNTKGGAL